MEWHNQRNPEIKSTCLKRRKQSRFRYIWCSWYWRASQPIDYYVGQDWYKKTTVEIQSIVQEELLGPNWHQIEAENMCLMLERFCIRVMTTPSKAPFRANYSNLSINVPEWALITLEKGKGQRLTWDEKVLLYSLWNQKGVDKKHDMQKACHAKV